MWLLSWRYSGSRVRAAVSSQASVAARMLLLRDGSRSTALLTALTLALRPCPAAQHPQPRPFSLSAAALKALKLVVRPPHHHHSCTGVRTLPRHIHNPEQVACMEGRSTVAVHCHRVACSAHITV